MRRRFCQFTLSKDNEISISFLSDVPKKAYIPETPRLALDLGPATLFATNKGTLTDRGFSRSFRVMTC
jgi:hypothetical protein